MATVPPEPSSCLARPVPLRFWLCLPRSAPGRSGLHSDLSLGLSQATVLTVMEPTAPDWPPCVDLASAPMHSWWAFPGHPASEVQPNLRPSRHSETHLYVTVTTLSCAVRDFPIPRCGARGRCSPDHSQGHMAGLQCQARPASRGTCSWVSDEKESQGGRMEGSQTVQRPLLVAPGHVHIESRGETRRR